MNNINKITKILGVTFVLAASGNALAATVNSTASVTVTNVVTITEDAALNFGSVRATADVTVNAAVLVLDSATGAVSAGTDIGTPTNAALSSLSAGNAGSYTVSDAANFTQITLTLPADDTVYLTATGVPSTNPRFAVNTFEATVFGGTNDGLDATTPANLVTDNTGSVSFNVGAELVTDIRTTGIVETYIDAAYEGSYAVTVTY